MKAKSLFNQDINEALQTIGRAYSLTAKEKLVFSWFKRKLEEQGKNIDEQLAPLREKYFTETWQPKSTDKKDVEEYNEKLQEIMDLDLDLPTPLELSDLSQIVQALNTNQLSALLEAGIITQEQLENFIK